MQFCSRAVTTFSGAGNQQNIVFKQAGLPWLLVNILTVTMSKIWDGGGFYFHDKKKHLGENCLIGTAWESEQQQHFPQWGFLILLFIIITSITIIIILLLIKAIKYPLLWSSSRWYLVVRNAGLRMGAAQSSPTRCNHCRRVTPVIIMVVFKNTIMNYNL